MNCPARVISASFVASAGISTGGPLSSSCAHSEPSSSGVTARRTSPTVTVCVPIAGTVPRRTRRVASRYSCGACASPTAATSVQANVELPGSSTSRATAAAKTTRNRVSSTMTSA